MSEGGGRFFLLPLWEKVAWTQSTPDEGSLSVEADPSPVASLREAPPSPTRGEGKEEPSPELTQFDLAGYLVAETDATDGQHHFGRQLFMTLEAAAGDGVADRFFDFTLRGDADLLEEAAQAGVENVLVHGALPMSRPVRMIQHVFAEIALAAVGAGVGVVALDVAFLSACDIFRRADRDIFGAAEGIVVIAARNGHGRLPPLEAAREQRGDEQERDVEPHGVKSHKPG